MSRNTDILARFGRRVRERRLALGLSREAFAAKCGLDRTYISGIERGQRNVAMRNILAIATALKTSISDLTRDL
jgi:transcriptional regulator with XRE-family HTH domain